MQTEGVSAHNRSTWQKIPNLAPFQVLLSNVCNVNKSSNHRACLLFITVVIDKDIIVNFLMKILAQVQVMLSKQYLVIIVYKWNLSVP